MPAAIQPSGLSALRFSFVCSPTSGATAPKAAMLQAVKEPARPETNAKRVPARTPLIGVALASWPRSPLATLSPITESTNGADQIAVSTKPATTAATAMAARRAGYGPAPKKLARG
ncbi:hypothetical protein GCM10017567_33180 [Amycolatopsis bullii]|uniref:Uncharacterized protein n=1 Tax=Amycolatopsis bullii TaxID=941987 RepID=A0ABQ3KCX6_9PSEU|nr:hypothetical protein GCM10017567_33180 [Amycolatopsis bullii]